LTADTPSLSKQKRFQQREQQLAQKLAAQKKSVISCILLRFSAADALIKDCQESAWQQSHDAATA
jgi:hypothetical protein